MADLIPLNKKQPKDLFISGGLDPLLEAVEQEALALSFDADPNTKKGQALLKSTARKVASSKTAIDAVGKEYVAEAKAKIKSVDQERKRARDFLDDLRDKIRQPVTDIENLEKARIESHQNRIQLIRNYGDQTLEESDPEVIEGIGNEIVDLMHYDFQELQGEADAAAKNAKMKVASTLKQIQARIEAERIAEEARVEAEVQKRLREEDKTAIQQSNEQAVEELEIQRNLVAEKVATTPPAGITKEHKRQVNRDAADSIADVIATYFDDSENDDMNINLASREIIKAIIKGEIPNVQVLY